MLGRTTPTLLVTGVVQAVKEAASERVNVVRMHPDDRKRSEEAEEASLSGMLLREGDQTIAQLHDLDHFELLGGV